MSKFKKKFSVDHVSTKHWATLSQWDYKKLHPQRYQTQVNFLLNHSKNISKNSVVLDLGCADGTLSSQLLFDLFEHCDAFDLSENFIAQGKKIAEDNGIKNIFFKATDIKKLRLKKLYDHCLCMGLFTCIQSEFVFYRIVNEMSKHMKIGGFLFLKDSLGESQRYYMNNQEYSAIYRKKSDYLRAFYENGFDLIEEEKVHGSHPDIFSTFFLLKKTKNRFKKIPHFLFKKGIQVS